MTEWSREVDEQSFLRSHVRGLVAELQGEKREDAFIVMITGLIIVAGGVLKLHAERTGIAVEDILTVLSESGRVNDAHQGEDAR
jgi:hypothetical protein